MRELSPFQGLLLATLLLLPGPGCDETAPPRRPAREQRERKLAQKKPSAALVMRFGSAAFGHSDPIVTASWSPDGSRIAGATSTGHCCSWDASGRLLWSRQVHRFKLRHVSFTADGKRIVGWSWLGRRIVVLEAASGNLLEQQDMDLPIHSLAIRGDLIAVGSSEGAVLLLRLGQLARPPRMMLAAEHNAISAIAISPDRRTLAVASRGTPVSLLRISDGKLLARHEPAGAGPRAPGSGRVAFSRDGKQLAIGQFVMATLELATGRRGARYQLTKPAELAGFSRRFDGPLTDGVSPDGRIMIRATRQLKLQLIDTATGRPHALAAAGHAGPLRLLAFLSQSRLISASTDSSIRIWDLANQRQFHQVRTQLAAAALSPDGRTLVSTAWAQLRLWSVPGLVCKRELRARVDRGPRVLAMLGGGHGLVAVARKGREVALAAHDPQTLARKAWLDTGDVALGGAPSSLASSPDGRSLAVAGQSLRVFDTRTGKPRRLLTEAVTLVRYSPDGKLLASVAGGRVTLRDPATLTPREQLDAKGVVSLCFTPDGRRLVTGHQDGTVRVMTLATGKSLPPLRISGTPEHLATSPSGNMLAVGLPQGQIQIWSLPR